MLSDLTITDFALIDQARIELQPGFNVLTGETGAGKSIIIGALAVLSGNKASPSLIRTGDSRAAVEAVFELEGDSPHWRRLGELGIEPDGDGLLIFRREISQRGRNRCLINNMAVTTTTMAEAIAGLLVIHGQHQQQVLLDPTQHLNLLDHFAGIWPERERFGSIHARLTGLLSEIATLKSQERDLARRKDLIQYQIQEIGDAELVPGEEEELAREEKILSSSHQYLELLQRAYATLFEEESSILTSLNLVRRDLEEVQRINDRVATTLEQFSTAFYQLEDVAGQLRDYRDRVELDPQRLEAVVQRRELIKRLKKKYGDSIGEILAYRDKIQSEFENVFEFDRKIARFESESLQVAEELHQAGLSLTQKRLAAAVDFKGRIEVELKELGMQAVQFEVQLTTIPPGEANPTPPVLPLRFGPEGFDRAEFLISPNLGEPLKPVARIASGGELSRIMLAVRGLIADLDSIGTLVFDEIDVGIGGNIARAVGLKIREIARNRQVICITHLPQIASMSPHHFLVTKEIHDGRTVSQILRLNDSERIDEIARMLDGEATAGLSKDHAAQLLEQVRGEANGNS